MVATVLFARDCCANSNGFFLATSFGTTKKTLVSVSQAFNLSLALTCPENKCRRKANYGRGEKVKEEGGRGGGGDLSHSLFPSAKK